MPVTSVNKMWSKDGSNARLNDSFRVLNVSIQEAYQVVCTPLTPIDEIYSAVDPTTGVRIPFRAEPHPDFPFCYLTGADPQRASPIMWIVSCDYVGEAGRDPTDNPLNKPTSVNWGDSATMEEIDEDFDGNALVNANGEPIRGIKVELVNDVVTLKKNFLTFSPYIRGQYRRSVNSDTFFGWPPGTAKVKQFDANNVIDAVIGYWQVVLKVEFRYPFNTTAERAWYSRTLHQGYTERFTVGGKPFPAIVTGPKSGSNKPVMLDVNGLRIPDGNPGFYIEKKLHDPLPFNALGF